MKFPFIIEQYLSIEYNQFYQEKQGIISLFEVHIHHQKEVHKNKETIKVFPDDVQREKDDT